MSCPTTNTSPTYRIRHLCSWPSARSGHSELDFIALLLTLNLQHTQRGHEPWTVWPIDLFIISRIPAELPCKLHGFATCFGCRGSFPAQNVHGPMIQAYFCFVLRNGSLAKERGSLNASACCNNLTLESEQEWYREVDFSNNWSRRRSRFKITVVPNSQMYLCQGWLWFWTYRNYDNILPMSTWGNVLQYPSKIKMTKHISWALQ